MLRKRHYVSNKETLFFETCDNDDLVAMFYSCDGLAIASHIVQLVN